MRIAFLLPPAQYSDSASWWTFARAEWANNEIKVTHDVTPPLADCTHALWLGCFDADSRADAVLPDVAKCCAEHGVHLTACLRVDDTLNDEHTMAVVARARVTVVHMWESGNDVARAPRLIAHIALRMELWAQTQGVGVSNWVYHNDVLFPAHGSTVTPSESGLVAHTSANCTARDGALLVTGGCGFIGSNFVNVFFDRACDMFSRIINVDAMHYCASEENVCARVRAHPQYEFHKLDLLDAAALRALIAAHPITHVVHFAAQSHVQSSFSDPRLFVRDNIEATVELLDACRVVRGARLLRFVYVSTDEVYGDSDLTDGHDRVKNEITSALHPTNPYAASKAGGELMALSFARSFRMPIIVTRGNNAYGPNQYSEKVIPRFIDYACRGEPLPVQGDGGCVRAFLHVHDVAEAFVCVLLRGATGEVYNIGIADRRFEFSVLDVADLVRRYVREQYPAVEASPIEHVADRPYNDRRYFISSARICALGWKPTVTFARGLRALVRATTPKIGTGEGV